MKMQKSKIYLVLYNKETKKEFKKYFDSEYQRDKFLRKLKYSKKIILIEDPFDYELYR